MLDGLVGLARYECALNQVPYHIPVISNCRTTVAHRPCICGGQACAGYVRVRPAHQIRMPWQPKGQVGWIP
jgi:hypothetical protein